MAPVTSLPFTLFVLRVSARCIVRSQTGGKLSRTFDPCQFSSSKIGPVYTIAQPKFRPWCKNQWGSTFCLLLPMRWKSIHSTPLNITVAASLQDAKQMVYTRQGVSQMERPRFTLLHCHICTAMLMPNLLTGIIWRECRGTHRNTTVQTLTETPPPHHPAGIKMTRSFIWTWYSTITVYVFVVLSNIDNYMIFDY